MITTAPQAPTVRATTMKPSWCIPLAYNAPADPAEAVIDGSDAQDIGVEMDDLIVVTLDGGCGRSFEAQVLQVRGDGQLKVQPVKGGAKVGFLQWVWERECVVLVKAGALE